MEDLAARYMDARADPELVVLEGFHAIKHALRFDAELTELRALDPDAAGVLADQLSPDLMPALARELGRISSDELSRISPRPHPTGMVAIARRPEYDLATALRRPGPAVLLEQPRHLGNLGACVRVAAAAAAAALISTGDADPWGRDALRGGAGLQFALPVLREPIPPESNRTLIAIDPTGNDLWSAELPPDALLAFGGERSGLSDELVDRASLRLRIPMRPGVSSLNLATSLAVVLFGVYGRRGP
ncbi:MAG: TrmH family RNA methyltransferase [Solirubrobacterales bacterium]